jgi:glycosyltransferase involved in cell wall biosynthesis
MEILRGAVLLFHPTLFDNGTFSVLEAAWHGVPSVSARYPAMEEIANRFSTPLTFFDPLDPNNIAFILIEAYQNRSNLQSKLPPRSFLEQFSPENNSVQFWRAIRAVVHQASAR